MVEVIPATTSEHLDAVRSLWTTYWNELGFTPCFQGFERELADLPGKYAPPAGRLLIGIIDGRIGGAVAFRPSLVADACEAKRLYVPAEFRGRGLAKILMERLFQEARAAGYRRIVGDTMPAMTLALAMYDRMGFNRTGPYPGSTDGAVYIEYQL
jgi:GNAT superfamily N-acetyltransferase